MRHFGASNLVNSHQGLEAYIALYTTYLFLPGVAHSNHGWWGINLPTLLFKPQSWEQDRREKPRTSTYYFPLYLIPRVMIGPHLVAINARMLSQLLGGKRALLVWMAGGRLRTRKARSQVSLVHKVLPRTKTRCDI